MLDQIEVYNAEITAASTEGRAPVLDGDMRTRLRVTGPTTQRRIMATLRAALNEAIRQRRITWNPCAGIELPEQAERETVVWSPEQVGTFLDHADAAGHRLALLYRLILLCGLRRGEAIGARWSDADLDAGRWRSSRLSSSSAARPSSASPRPRAGGG